MLIIRVLAFCHIEKEGKDDTGRGVFAKCGLCYCCFSGVGLGCQLLQFMMDFGELFEGVVWEVLSYFLKYSKGSGRVWLFPARR